MRAEQYGEPFFQAAAEPKPIARHDEARCRYCRLDGRLSLLSFDRLTHSLTYA